jgi:hypothetical protein
MPRFIVQSGKSDERKPRAGWLVIDTTGEASPAFYVRKDRAESHAAALNMPRHYPAGSVGAYFMDRKK